MTLLKSDYETLVDLFFKAKKQLIISMPNITFEIAEAIISTHNRGVNVHLFIEFTEQSFRAGYGDIRAIEKLKNAGIEFCNKSGINIYFIVSDDDGYFYFPKSLFFEKEGTTFDLFPMERQQVKTLKVVFKLHDEDYFKTDDIIENVGIETLAEVSKGIKAVDSNQASDLIHNIESQPVLNPNIGRLVEVYKAKFQFVELVFKNSKLQSRRVKLPHNALPFEDEDLIQSIEASLKLFSNLDTNQNIKLLLDLPLELDDTREKLLVPITSRKKRIIRVSDKDLFSHYVCVTQLKIKSVKEKVENDLQCEIINTQDKIKKTLVNFYKHNIPPKYSSLKGIALERMIENEVNGIISKIKFPLASELLKDLKIEYYFYDITWEDLNDDQFIEELVKNNLITEDEKAYITKNAIEVEEQV